MTPQNRQRSRGGSGGRERRVELFRHPAILHAAARLMLAAGLPDDNPATASDTNQKVTHARHH